MTSEHSLDGIPDDLLSHIFDYFTLAQLVRLMPVSRRWRTQVIEHRTYWMHIDLLRDSPLDVATEAEIDLFALRLSRSAPKHTMVTVLCCNPDAVLAHIAAHLSHIKGLNMMSAKPVAASVLAALCHAAPILERFSLSFRDGSIDCMPVPIPANLFDFNAPVLKRAYVTGVFLEAPIPSVLQHLQHLGVGGTVRIPDVHFEIPDVFSACPNLRTLSLYQDVTLSPVFWQPEAWRNIKRLSFFGATIARTWHLLGLPILRVPFIDVMTDDASMLPILASHLDGPLILTANRFPHDDRFDVTLTEDSPCLRARRLGAFLPPANPRAIADEGMWTRIVCIILAIEHWDNYVPFFGHLPALEDVDIVVSKPWNAPALSATLSCPVLKRLSLCNRFSLMATVRIEYLAELASRVLHGAPFPLDLYLENMRLEGAAETAAAEFRTITVDEDASTT